MKTLGGAAKERRPRQVCLRLSSSPSSAAAAATTTTIEPAFPSTQSLGQIESSRVETNRIESPRVLLFRGLWRAQTRPQPIRTGGQTSQLSVRRAFMTC